MLQFRDGIYHFSQNHGSVTHFPLNHDCGRKSNLGLSYTWHITSWHIIERGKNQTCKKIRQFLNTQKWKEKMIIGSKKSGCFFSVLLFFWGWGWAGEEYQNFWNHIHFLDFPASLGLAFHPTGTGGQVEQKNFKTFRPPSVWGAQWVWLVWKWPQDMWRTPNGWWYYYGIFIYLLMLFQEDSETFTPIHNSCQKAVFPKNRGKIWHDSLQHYSISYTTKKKVVFTTRVLVLQGSTHAHYIRVRFLLT